MYLAIEGLSLALYTLVGLNFKNIHSIEGSIKYLFLGAISAGFLLLGIALLYIYTGSTNFMYLRLYFMDFASLQNTFLILRLGIVFISAGLLFKLSAVPCHI
jgi:NADH-quinone oxidoreductase subunit N